MRRPIFVVIATSAVVFALIWAAATNADVTLNHGGTDVVGVNLFGHALAR
jgi:hypothetical protein